MNNYSPQTSQLGNIFYTLSISLEEAAIGKTESLSIPRADVCEACSGTGQSWRNDDGTCSNCGNQGLVRYEKRLQVHIPPGVDTGSRLRIPSEGNLEVAQVARGDLFITINVGTHELFVRKGKDLHSFFKLAKNEIKNGGEVIVPTLLDGQKRLRVPPNTTDGTVFRLAGLGLRSLEIGERGDLFIKVGTKTIKHVNDDPKSPAFATPPMASTRRSAAAKKFLLNHRKGLILAAGILTVIGFLYVRDQRSSPPVSPPPDNTNTSISPSPSTQPTAEYSTFPAPVAEPPVRLPFSLPNGANIIPPQGPRGDMTMKVINDNYQDMALKIISQSSQKTRRFVYVRAGGTAVIKNLAREFCLLRWETGSDWDVNSHRFLDSRSIHQFDKDFDLRRVRYTINFTPSPEGTLQETPIDESEFEDK